MTFEGLIATPFGYLLDGLYQLTGTYGLALMIFAVLVQLIVIPLGYTKGPVERIYMRNKAIIAKIKPLEEALFEEYKDNLNSDELAEKNAALYDAENFKWIKHYGISALYFFLSFVLPLVFFIPIFQAVAQPITYLFHEAPETAAAIVKVMREEAPELFVSGYNQVTAITHIQEFAEVVKAQVPEVSARTLEGLDYHFLGLGLDSVPGVHVLGKSDWAWDWAHIGVILIPIAYLARRIINTFLGIYATFSAYAKEKKRAKEANEAAPKLPNPPLLPIIFLFLSATALFAVPIAMNLYWLTGGIAASILHKTIGKKLAARFTPAPVVADDASIITQQVM